MQLPINYLITYDPVTFKDSYFESSLRHMSDYDKMLTEIETKSKTLSELLLKLAETADKERLEEYKTLINDECYYNELYYTCGSREIDSYANHMCSFIHQTQDKIAKIIIDGLDKELYEKVRELYIEVTCLLDDKYNDFDKYYLDDFFWGT